VQRQDGFFHRRECGRDVVLLVLCVRACVRVHVRVCVRVQLYLVPAEHQAAVYWSHGCSSISLRGR